MKPDDVPAELIDLAEQACVRLATTAPPGAYDHEAIRRHILAAVLPAHTERVLTAAADQLDAMPETNGAALKGPYWYRDGWKQATGMLRDWADYPAALADRLEGDAWRTAPQKRNRQPTRMRHALAAAWPEIERQVRAQVAAEAREFAAQFAAAKSAAMQAESATLRWFAERLDEQAADKIRGETR